MATSTFRRPLLVLATGIGLAAALSFGATSTASAATVIDGPVDLGTAASFGVLGGQTVTNAGVTVVSGDVGVWSGTAITGFDGPTTGNVVDGTVYRGTTEAADAQRDTTTAYDVAASLTPTGPAVAQLDGLSLSPGVYRGSTIDLAVGGTLTLAGSADSVWVFQAGSTLTVNSQAKILVTGGASACNVFWQVGSAATIGTGAQFEGTVLALQSVTADTGATVAGRLLARNGAVTLDNDTITRPTGCGAPGTSSESPTITSSTPPPAVVGTPYSFTVTATGTPAPTYTATGALPSGLTLNGTTGVISGTPTSAGTSTITVTASNGTAPSDSVTYVLTVRVPTPAEVTAPTSGSSVPAATTAAATGGSGTGGSGSELAFTGSDSAVPLTAAALLLASGLTLTAIARRRRAAHRA